VLRTLLCNNQNAPHKYEEVEEEVEEEEEEDENKDQQ